MSLIGPDEADPQRAPFHATLALTGAWALGACLIMLPLVHRALPATVLPPPFPEQHQDAETLIFILAFAAVAPLAALLVPRLADVIAARSNRRAISPLAAFVAGSLLGAIVLVKLVERISSVDALTALLVLVLLWAALAAAACARTASPRPSAVLAQVADRSALAWSAALLPAAVVPFLFADLGSIAIGPLLAGAAITLVLVAIVGRRLPALPRPWGRVLDLAAVGLLLLAVPNLVIVSPEDPSQLFDTTIIQFHQNFFLGPAAQVLGGGTMLVDTLSQYGVGSIYFLVGVFEVVPIGNGTLGLVEGVLSALMFAGAFGAMRLAGVSRPLAIGTMGVALVALVYGLTYPIGGLLQHGAIRFGLPLGVLLPLVAAARLPARAKAARVVALVFVGVASVWALEAFAYTLLVLTAMVVTGAMLLPRAARRRHLLGWLAATVGFCVLAHVLFALATLIAAGELPDWTLYIETLRAFLVGGIGDLTFDFTPWSPAFAVGGLLLVSALALILLIRRREAIAERDPVAIVALAGSTAWGVALFSYFVNRSGDDILPYVCLPVMMVVALWLHVLLTPEAGLDRRVRRAATALAALAALLLVAVAWSSAGTRFSQSALAYAPPGGKSLRAGLERLWDRPPIAAGAEEAERLLNEDLPDEERSIVLTSADLAVESLIRTGRTNRIPLSDPWEDSLAPSQHLERLEVALGGFRAGDRVLLDAPALDVFAGYQREPDRDPLSDPFSRSTLAPSGIATLQEFVLKGIGERFDLRTVAEGGDGLRVAELVPRRGLSLSAGTSASARRRSGA